MKHYYVISFQATIDYKQIETGTMGTCSPVLNPNPNIAQDIIKKHYEKKNPLLNIDIAILSHPKVTTAEYNEAAKDFTKM